MFGPDDQVDEIYKERRERVFLLLAGLFLGSLTMLNILGLTRMIDISFSIGSVNIPLTLTMGVLPYPITFLCTDFISEIYGQKRANMLVWAGLMLNIWVILIMYLGGALPGLENYDDSAFFKIKQLTTSSVTASMIAYLLAQFIDVKIFHYLKKLTKGKHLWLRNNASTIISQLVDSFAVILIAHWSSNAFNLQGQADAFDKLIIIIFSGYIYKLTTALLDTIPFYYGTKFLSEYLKINPNKNYEDSEESLTP